MNLPQAGGVESLPDATIATLFGELNTEARCVVASSIPNDLVPLQEVRNDLYSRNAYALISNRRFNVGGIVNAFAPGIIAKSNDPTDNSVWVQRGVSRPDTMTTTTHTGGSSNPTGNFVAGAAGALLAFSEYHDVPLRNIVGEKHAPKGENFRSATEARLGIFAIIATLSNSNDSFTGQDVTEHGQTLDLQPGPIRTQLRDLTAMGFLERDTTKRPKIYRTAKLPNGTEAMEVIMDLLSIVGKFAIGSVHAQEHGIQQGRQILDDPKILPSLIYKSYEASGHTGKTFTRRVPELSPALTISV